MQLLSASSLILSDNFRRVVNSCQYTEPLKSQPLIHFFKYQYKASLDKIVFIEFSVQNLEKQQTFNPLRIRPIGYCEPKITTIIARGCYLSFLSSPTSINSARH